MITPEGCDPGEELGLLAAGTSPGQPFLALSFQLSSIGFAVSLRFKAALAPFEIEPRQFSLLRALGVAEGQSQKAIAERLRVPASSMVTTVDDLEKRGLLERHVTSDDRRVRTLHLTQAGKELLEKVLPVAMETESSVRDALGPEDSSRLAELLGKVGAIFGVIPGAAHSALREGA